MARQRGWIGPLSVSRFTPIVRATVLDLERQEEPRPTGRFSLPAGAAEGIALEPGPRLFFVFELEIKALRDEIELVVATVTPAGELDERLSEQFLSLTGRATNVAGNGEPGPDIGELLSDDVVDRAAETARAWAGTQVAEKQAELERVAGEATDVQLESLRLSHERNVGRIREQLADAEANGQERIARMRRGQLSNVSRRYDEKVRELELRRGVEVGPRGFGEGVVGVYLGD